MKKSTLTTITYYTFCTLGLASFCVAENTKNSNNATVRGMGQFCKLIGIIITLDAFLTLNFDIKEKEEKKED